MRRMVPNPMRLALQKQGQVMRGSSHSFLQRYLKEGANEPLHGSLLKSEDRNRSRISLDTHREYESGRSTMPKKIIIGALLIVGFLSTRTFSFPQVQVQVTMDIAADETYRVFVGDEYSVSTVIATDWDDCDCRWNSAESYTFDVHRGGYIYVVASNHYGPSMLLVRLSYADGTVIYSGVNHPLANWEVSNIFREVLTMYPPPEPEDVNRWIASTTSWESPSIGGEAGLNVSRFAYLRPARYIWKFPGGSSVWGFSGYTGPGTALFRIRVPSEPGNRPPAVPTLIAPAHNARVSSLPTFQLRASDPDGDRVRFEVQVWQGNDVRTFSVPASGYVASDQVASGTPPQPLPAGTWRWKARTWDQRGGVSSWSGERVFVVEDIQSSPTPPTPAGTPNVAWGPLVRVSPRPNGWDSDTKRLVAGKRVNNVLYLAFSHDRRLSDALTFSSNSGRVEVRLTQRGVYWVPANSISSLTQISDPLEIPAYVVVKRSGSDPAICYGINACNLLGNDVEEFYAICLRVMLSNGERVPPNQTTVMDYLKAIGQSNQIPPHLLWAIAWEETLPEFRWSHVRSDGWSLLTFDGGIGMMQLTQGSAVWGPRYIGGGWLDNRVIPNDLLTHLYKLAADWQYNVRAGAALLNLPAGRVLGPPDGTLVRPVLEHWWFRVWRYNGISCDDDTNGWRCNLGPFSYPERIRFWLSRTPCETPPYPRVADSMELIGIPAFMQYGSCNAGISFAPTPYPANIDIDFDGTIDARIKGVSSPSNLWDNNGELYFQVESVSSVSVQEVRVLNAEAREQYRQAGGGTIRCCAGLQSGYIVVRLNDTDVKTYFSSQQFIWRTPGDVNGDGCVDDADLLAVLFAFGCSTGCGVEDINGDGVVDDADLLEVLFHFGSGC
jgi:hypothetical protein